MLLRFARSLAAAAVAIIAFARAAPAIDFYELQIYYVDTVPQNQLMAELHSNWVPTSTGELAKSMLPTYQIHNTLEVTYGITRWLEIGEYLCTARLNTDNYEYAGARTKIHFAIPQTESWPIAFGANLELDYMRMAAEPQALSFDFMPIFQMTWGKALFIGNLDFSKPFNGPGNKGVDFQPAAAASYQLFDWIAPRLEYWGDTGPLSPLASLQAQQHFIAPGFNLTLDPRFEFNFGVGFGVTRGSNGTFIKSTIGWLF